MDWLRLGVLLPDCWVLEDVITEEFVISVGTMFVAIFSVCCLMKVSQPEIKTQIIIIAAPSFSFWITLHDLQRNDDVYLFVVLMEQRLYSQGNKADYCVIVTPYRPR